MTGCVVCNVDGEATTHVDAAIDLTKEVTEEM